MAKVHALVLRAAGTNCDHETAFAFQSCGAAATVLPLQPFLDNPDQLGAYQILALPGGFSYGDDILAGRVCALELVHRAGEQIQDLVARGGVVLGICNGFQVLVQMGLLPGLEAPMGQLEVSLASNEVGVYQDRWVRLRAEASNCAFFEDGDELYLPMAHAEGRLVPRDAQVRKALQTEGRVAFRYVGAGGDRAPGFPDNPNGSIDHIAGLTDHSGRILGLMPHPERHMFPFQHPCWTREGLRDEADGLRVFRRAIEIARGGR